MPRKIQRSSSKTLPTVSKPRGNGTSSTYGHTVQAAASIYVATANVVAVSINSVAECGTAFFNYLEECQRTRQVQLWSDTVIAEARECTRQMEIQAEALITEAQEQTRRIEIQAKLTKAQLGEIQATRESRMMIICKFLDAHHQLHQLFISKGITCTQNFSIEERVRLAQYRDDIICRLRDLELAVANLSNQL